MFGFGEDERADIARWRKRAEELRALAAEASNATSRDVQQDLAGTYERLARQAEERNERRRGQAAPEKSVPPAPKTKQPPPRASRSHRFKVGQTVSFGTAAGGLLASPELLRILHIVATDGTENQYWVKSMANGAERIASESQLHPVPEGAGPPQKRDP
ncbi:MAG: hypothetical protein U1F33_01305 [Alphaproteobacteria bacterium]